MRTEHGCGFPNQTFRASEFVIFEQLSLGKVRRLIISSCDTLKPVCYRNVFPLERENLGDVGVNHVDIYWPILPFARFPVYSGVA